MGESGFATGGVQRAALLEALLAAGELDLVALSGEVPGGTERPPSPGTLGDTVFVSGVPASVELCYGEPGTTTGRLLRVTTAPVGPARQARPSIRALAEALTRELPTAPGGSGPVRLDDRPVFLAGRPCSWLCQVGDGDGRWVVRLRVAAPARRPGPARFGRADEAPRTVDVTVVARGWEPATLHLDWIASLRTVLAGPPR